MKKYLIIFCAALAYLFLSSRSCEGPEQQDILTDEEVLAATKDSIEHRFASDDLSPALLNALEIQAQQKLADFGDYLNLYTDASLDSAFRIQARGMVRELFIADTVQINPLLMSHAGGMNLSMNDFLVTQTNIDSPTLLIDSIRTIKSLSRTDEVSYKGIISFQRQIQYHTGSDTLLSDRTSMAAEIIAFKAVKAIGSDTLRVWEVSLGGIW